MAETPIRPTDPHPSDEEHYDREQHPGGANPPDDRHAGIEVHAHDGRERQAGRGIPIPPRPMPPEPQPKANATKTVMWIFVAALVLVLVGLWVTMSGVLPGDDGSEPTREAPTVLPQP